MIFVVIMLIVVIVGFVIGTKINTEVPKVPKVPEVLPLGLYIDANGNPYEFTKIDIVASSNGYSQFYYIHPEPLGRSTTPNSHSNSTILHCYKKE